MPASNFLPDQVRPGWRRIAWLAPVMQHATLQNFSSQKILNTQNYHPSLFGLYGTEAAQVGQHYHPPPSSFHSEGSGQDRRKPRHSILFSWPAGSTHGLHPSCWCISGYMEFSAAFIMISQTKYKMKSCA